ncbi:CPBP family intramembrane glutamic endopeptidase [Gelidibacter algens]|nr:CPBP family intramembrane glutamic endopeptidase [Gelidibacter algens]
MKILKRNISDLGWKWGDTKYQVRSYLIPLFYAFIAYIIIWSFGWGGFYNEETVTWITKSIGIGDIGDGFSIMLYVLLVGVFGIIGSMSSALGEEIGWRGFLVPELYKSQGFTKTSLITGLIWGVWHLPILLFADYNSGTPSWFAMPCFMILVISISFIYTWFRMKSGSLWTAVILHGSHNLFIQSIFTPLTEDTGNTAYYIDEFGIVLPIVAIGFAIYYWSKRNELKTSA